MNRDDAAEFSEALAQIGEGWWRQVGWAFRQGIHDALGMTRKEWRETYYGHLKIDEDHREDAVTELHGEGMSNRAIADALGVAEGTVRNDLAAQDYAPETDQPQESKDAEPPAAQDYAPDNGDEWYTPKWLFDALNIPFEMDVCAPIDRTYCTVPARHYLTVEDDGLAHRWEGTIWCNPPYSKPEPWARRLMHHGDGLLLTHVPINGGWFVDVMNSMDCARIFQAIEFVRPDGSTQRPGYWLVLAAYGEASFRAVADLQPLGGAAGNPRRFGPLLVRQGTMIRPVR